MNYGENGHNHACFDLRRFTCPLPGKGFPGRNMLFLRRRVRFSG
jgi:hypothetical protein